MLASPRSWRLDVSTFRQRIDSIASWFWNAPHPIGRAAVALGHIALIVVLVRQGALPWLTSRLAAVGQTALSNYIATSMIGVLLFYTPGFGLMGQLQRYQLYFVVLGVWAFNLTWSPLWLRRDGRKGATWPNDPPSISPPGLRAFRSTGRPGSLPS